MMKTTCKWEFIFAKDQNGIGFYETECGQAIMLHPNYEESALEKGLIETGIRYCCYCGKVIKDE